MLHVILAIPFTFGAVFQNLPNKHHFLLYCVGLHWIIDDLIKDGIYVQGLRLELIQITRFIEINQTFHPVCATQSAQSPNDS